MNLLKQHAIVVAMAIVSTMAAGSQVVIAAPILWISDSRGTLGYVDVADGSTVAVGFTGVMSDLAFDYNGDLWGLGYLNNPTLLYRIDQVTGETEFVGSTSIDRMNGLTFGPDGTLWGATSSDVAVPSLYKIDTSNGVATLVGSMGFACAGDLAFSDDTLYMAAASPTPGGNDLLVRLDTTTGIGTMVGSFGLPYVYGFDIAQEDRIAYATSGTSIYSVDLATGATTFVLDYGQDLRTAYGTAFAGVPEPGTIIILLVGGVLLSLHRRRCFFPAIATQAR